MPSLEVVEVVSVQCNLVDNQYQQNSEVYSFMPNKYYVYLLNVEPSNLAFLRGYNTTFDKVIIRFSDQNDRPLEIEEKLILRCLIINRTYTLFYRAKKDSDFCHLLEIYLGINASKDVIHNAAEATGKQQEIKIAGAVAWSYDNKILKQKPVIDEDSSNSEEIIFPPKKAEEILN